MVLVFFDANDTPLVLDNLMDQIIPTKNRDDLIPIYSFNTDSVWIVKSGVFRKAGKSTELKPWRNLMARIPSETLSLSKANISAFTIFVSPTMLNLLFEAKSEIGFRRGFVCGH